MHNLIIAKAHAQMISFTPPGSCNFRTGIFSWECIPDYIIMITSSVVIVTASVSLLLLMYNGVRYMLGPVTEGSTDNAKKGIRNAIIGLVICILAYIVVDTIVKAVTP